MVYYRNRALYRSSDDHSEYSNPEKIRHSDFFIDYQSHSRKLTEALVNWGRKIRFSSCEYRDGLLTMYPQQPIESMDKGHLRFMKKHLEKETKYRPILETISKIEQDHTELCKKIKNVIASDEPVSVSPSFEKIILNKIQSSCPTLMRSIDYYLQHDNIFLHVYIFRAIFETVYSRESSISLSETPIENNRCRLWYKNQVLALGQGDCETIKNLSDAVKELVQNNVIRERVEEYVRLHRQLIADSRIDELKDKIEELWTVIDGGGYLAGFDACELCDPSKSAPTR